MKNFQKGFTLVELIVVITILAILGTIAFITLQTWTKSSRNSVRIADMSTISHGLEIFVATHAKYPNPSGAVTITYSGASVWEQGTFGEDSSRGLNSLSTIPVDPTLGTQYAYSVTSIGSEYELGGVLETGTLISGNMLYNQAYADTGFKATTQGNYNGSVVRVSTGAYDFILGVPTILASDTSDADLLQIIQNRRLVFDGYQTPPAGMGVSQEDFIDFHSVNPNNILVFSGSIQDINTQENKLLVAENLKTVYTSTGTQDNPSYQIFTTLDLDTDPAAAMQKAEDVLLGQLKLNGIVERQTYETEGGSIVILPVCATALSQSEADELNSVSGQSYTIEDWCTLTVLDMHYDNKGVLPQLTSIPSGIFKMTSLQELKLHDHAITSIPSTISNLTNLQDLDMAGNLLTSLPNEIGNLNSLITLRVEDNQLTSLPSTIGNLINLQNLFAPLNLLTSLPNEIGNLTNLTHLQLNENNISSVPSSIGSLTALEQFVIHSNQLSHLPSELTNINTLKTLDLSNNPGLGNFSTLFTENSTAEYKMGECGGGGDAYMGIEGNNTTINIFCGSL